MSQSVNTHFFVKTDLILFIYFLGTKLAHELFGLLLCFSNKSLDCTVTSNHYVLGGKEKQNTITHFKNNIAIYQFGLDTTIADILKPFPKQAEGKQRYNLN